MTDWHTNLIKSYVLSPSQRRAYYLAMVSFLVLCSLSLVGIVYEATSNLVRTVHEQNKIRRLEEKFRDLHGGLKGNLDQVAGKLEKDLQHAHDRLTSASRMVDRRISLSKVLAGLRQPLPHDMRLARLDLNPSRGIVQFDLVMPESPDQELTQALVDAWNTQPLLKTELRDIRIMARHTQRVGDQSVVVLRLEGELAEGKE